MIAAFDAVTLRIDRRPILWGVCLREDNAMRNFRVLFVSVVCCVAMIGCGSAGVPKPIKILENPSSGERVRFFREIGYKVPKGYDENKHIAEWTATQKEAGFTKEISPTDDREALAALHAKNREVARR